jgi:tRNA (guanine-N7-)-methyltransferase
MARCALRKIDPSLDLSGHFFEAEQLPVPFDGAAIFGREAPLELEVGTGKGLFLVTASADRPEHNFLGCEISRGYARFAAARLTRLGRSNAVVVHDDAQRLLRSLPGRLATAVHVYFPDPWWKKRHHKRRIMNNEFLAQVHRILELGGSFHFWTDVEEYFQVTLGVIAEATGFQGPLDVPERSATHAMDYATHFERKKRLLGLAVHRAEFRRVLQ